MPLERKRSQKFSHGKVIHRNKRLNQEPHGGSASLVSFCLMPNWWCRLYLLLFVLYLEHPALPETLLGIPAGCLHRVSPVSFCWMFVILRVYDVTLLLVVFCLEFSLKRSLLCPGFFSLSRILVEYLTNASPIEFCWMFWAALNLTMFCLICLPTYLSISFYSFLYIDLLYAQ